MNYEFKVEGMSCQSCVNHVTRAVRSVDADAQVKVDLPTQKVTVQGASSDEANLKAAIADAGYPVLETRQTG